MLAVMLDPVVKVTTGKIRGKLNYGIRGDKYYSFQGVPYARPPVGDLRFRAPLPLEPWKGIKDATKDANCSIQEGFGGKLIGSEDCLYLNIFTPNLPFNNVETKRLGVKPVIVYIHGGSFVIGSNKTKLTGPRYLMTKNVVLVTINYRLGLLGLLNCEDEELEIPGNASFKDMVMALKWVKENIMEFMGDSTNITLMGQSAGAISAHLLLLSPLTKGADILNFKNIPADDLLIEHGLFHKTIPNGNRRRYIGLTIEKHSTSAFMTQHPLEILKSGNYPKKIPILMGFNSNEGAVLEIILQKSDLPLEMFWTKNDMLVPYYWNIEEGSPLSMKLGKKIIEHYFREKKSLEKLRHGVFEVHSDIFTFSVLKAAMVHSKDNPVFLYKNIVESQLNLFKSLLGTNNPGVYHGDELGYLFDTIFSPKIEENSLEDLTQRRFLSLWTNFAKFGNPTPFRDCFIETEWKRTDPVSLCYLELGETLTMETNPIEQRIEFWYNLEKEAMEMRSKL